MTGRLRRAWGDRWIHLPRRGIAVHPAAAAPLATHTWRSRELGVTGLLECASVVRDALRRGDQAPLPPAVRRRWREWGRPTCWVRFAGDGVRSQIIVPNEYVGHVANAEAAACRRLAESVVNQRKFGAVAPKVMDSGPDCYREAFVTVRRLAAPADAVNAMAAKIREIAPAHMRRVGDVVESLLARAAADDAVRTGAARIADHADTPVAIGLVHGDLLPRNLFRRRDGSLVALDWEFSREAPATYDFWQAPLWDWIKGRVSRAQWRTAFRHAVATHMPAAAAQADVHETLNILALYAFFTDPDTGATAPVKARAAAQLLAGADAYSGQ